MTGSRKGWNAALALVMGGLAAGAFACSAPPPQKTPLVVCEAGENGCPSEKPKSSKQKSKKNDDDDDGPSGAPAPAPSSPSEDEQNPPETDPETDPEPVPDPTPGPICTNLKVCCGQLKAAGYSDATCLEIVDTNSETACSLQHKQYKDFGDCT